MSEPSIWEALLFALAFAGGIGLIAVVLMALIELITRWLL